MTCIVWVEWFFIITFLAPTCVVLLVPIHTPTGIRPTADGIHSLLGGLGSFCNSQTARPTAEEWRTFSRRFGITLHGNSVSFLNWMLFRDVEVVFLVCYGSYPGFLAYWSFFFPDKADICFSSTFPRRNRMPWTWNLDGITDVVSNFGLLDFLLRPKGQRGNDGITRTSRCSNARRGIRDAITTIKRSRKRDTGIWLVLIWMRRQNALLILIPVICTSGYSGHFSFLLLDDMCSDVSWKNAPLLSIYPLLKIRSYILKYVYV